MNEHGWPGWPDDPTGGDSDHGGLHDDPDAGLHDPGPGVGDPDHGWPADDSWAHHDTIGEADLDEPVDRGAADPHTAGHGTPDHGIPDHHPAEYDHGSPDTPEPATTGTDPTMGPVGADPDAGADTDSDAADPEDPFPPVVDVGALPEPVDGFPWIDTGSLGPVGAEPAADLVTPEHLSADLAAYAATDLAPGADPWAELATSDDPATSALARWWAPEQ